MGVFIFQEVDLTKVKYTQPEKKGLVYYSGISYNGEPFHIQTPKLKCLMNGDDCVKRKSPSLDVENINNDFKFYDFLLSLDEKNVTNTYEESEKWFDKNIPKETIDEMYKRILKPVKKGSRPVYSFKIPTFKDKIQSPIFDQHKVCQSIDKFKDGVELELIIHIRGLKFLKQNYYCDLYISQIKIYLPNDEKYSVINDFSFKDMHEDEKKENIDEEEQENPGEKAEVEEEKAEVEVEKAEVEVEKAEVEKVEENLEKVEVAEKEEEEVEDVKKIKEDFQKRFLLLQEQLNLMKNDLN